ncbi:MAG: hypothetical protein C0467_00230 [Planctomycetaceae bacterium]|nr:hypothetical protein [Planctomycetaceae bacterium]
MVREADAAANLSDQHHGNRHAVTTACELHPLGQKIDRLDRFRAIRSDNCDATGVVGGLSEHG